MISLYFIYSPLTVISPDKQFLGYAIYCICNHRAKCEPKKNFLFFLKKERINQILHFLKEWWNLFNLTSFYRHPQWGVWANSKCRTAINCKRPNRQKHPNKCRMEMSAVKDGCNTERVRKENTSQYQSQFNDNVSKENVRRYTAVCMAHPYTASLNSYFSLHLNPLLA